jgi:hypothetical protein
MGFFDFLKPKQKVNVSITTHEPTKDEIAKQYAGYCKAQTEKRHAEQEERANDNFLALSADDLADKNGLKPTEILMLSYLEKYSSGKPVAKFWHYDYGVDDVWPIIKKLESMGFAENGKLTEKGKAEIKANEYVSQRIRLFLSQKILCSLGFYFAGVLSRRKRSKRHPISRFNMGAI